MQERHAESRTLTGEVRKQVEFRSKIIRLHSVVDIRTIEPVEHYVTPMAPASDVVASSFIVCLSLRSETVPGAELLGKNFLAEGSAEWFSAESVDGQRACCWQWSRAGNDLVAFVQSMVWRVFHLRRVSLRGGIPFVLKFTTQFHAVSKIGG